MSTKLKVVVGPAVLALAMAGGAAANAAWRFITVHRREVALFRPGAWSCNNYGPRVECQSGDAFPYAILTGSARGGVTVKVVRLAAAERGHLRTTRDRAGHLVYVFTAS